MGFLYQSEETGEKVEERAGNQKIKCGLCRRWFTSGIVRSYCSPCAAFLGICSACGSSGEQDQDGKRFCSVCRKRIRYRGKNWLKKRVNGRTGKGEGDGKQDEISGIEGRSGNRGNDQGDCGGTSGAGGSCRVHRAGLVR